MAARDRVYSVETMRIRSCVEACGGGAGRGGAGSGCAGRKLEGLNAFAAEEDARHGTCLDLNTTL